MICFAIGFFAIGFFLGYAVACLMFNSREY